LPRLASVRRVQPDAAYACGFLDEISGRRAISSHDGTSGECEAKGVCLIVEIENYLA